MHPADRPAPRRPLRHDLMLRWQFMLHRHRRDLVVLEGYHNHNFVVPLSPGLAALVGVPPGTPGKFRTPLSTLQVVPRCFPDEADVLAAVGPHLPHVPATLHSCGRYALHTFAEGDPLSYHRPRGTAVPGDVMRQIARIMGDIAAIPPSALPPLPLLWPTDGDGTSFLRRLVNFAEFDVHQRYRPHFGGLFTDLGIPADTVTRFRALAADLQSRPFALLHTDLHRDNLVLRTDGRIEPIDWETALFGDPLHELATHLVRMAYTDDECEHMTELWTAELERRGLHPLTKGVESDLRTYVDFERAQSVFADTMRSAHSLHTGFSGAALEAAASSILRALRAARIHEMPRRHHVIAALQEWRSRASIRRLRRRRPPRRPRAPPGSGRRQQVSTPRRSPSWRLTLSISRLLTPNLAKPWRRGFVLGLVALELVRESQLPGERRERAAKRSGGRRPPCADRVG